MMYYLLIITSHTSMNTPIIFLINTSCDAGDIVKHSNLINPPIHTPRLMVVGKSTVFGKVTKQEEELLVRVALTLLYYPYKGGGLPLCVVLL